MSDPADAPAAERRRILTGLRPSGPSHVGHYAGAFSQWLELQDEYESFFLLADYQVSDYADNLPWIRWGLWEVTLDWLGVGLDPDVSHFVIESGVPEFAELTLHLSWFLGLGHLQRNPTLKAELASLESTNKTVPVAFFNYPVMQISNILLPLAHLVPVGEDQLPHIEMTRDVAIRFNRRFGETFVIPEGRVGEVPRLVGIDGKGKMGTSAGNAIFLKTPRRRCGPRCGACSRTPSACALPTRAPWKATRCSCTTTPSTRTRMKWTTSRPGIGLARSATWR